MRQPVRTLDPSALPAHFDSPAAEKRWNEVWQRTGAYAWDAASTREQSFVIDTPPADGSARHERRNPTEENAELLPPMAADCASITS